MAHELVPGAALPTVTVRAVNTSADSRGSIHDDEKAREMGYRGGLVPGVTVMGYMSRLMHEVFGPTWGAGGRLQGQLRRPVYGDDEVTVTGRVVNVQDGEVEVEVQVVDPQGHVCAAAMASCRQ